MNGTNVLEFVSSAILAFVAASASGGASDCDWSYPPRYWPCWEVLRARAHTYATGQYVGYPTRLKDAKSVAEFRDRDGRVMRVSGASRGGVPCVKGTGWQARIDGVWVDCDVFEGQEDVPPHLLGFPSKRKTPRREGGLYEADGETVAFVYCRSKTRPVLRVGESREEALNEDPEWFEQSCWMEPTGGKDEWRSAVSLAFRHYRFVAPVEETWYVCDEMRRPLLGTYRSGDARREKIWRACAETVRLCTRRFFVDAVKRDRLPWAGDAATGFLADFATYRNAEAARFTIDAEGWTPGGAQADYDPWWVIINGLYRRLYGDVNFIRSRWSVIRSRTDDLAALVRGDGVVVKDPRREFFIDWGERGEPTTAYNVLTFGALDTAAALAEEIGEEADAVRWRTLAEKVRAAVLRLACDSDTGLLKTDIFNPEGTVYRQANIFAVLFGLAPDEAARRIGDRLAGAELPPVGSTWMSGLECVALTLTGHSDVVLRRIDEEWGGMVDRGYNVAFEHWWRDAKGPDSYRFYDRPFGLSLCHLTAAWPAYLLPAIQKGLKENPFRVKEKSK